MTRDARRKAQRLEERAARAVKKAKEQEHKPAKTSPPQQSLQLKPWLRIWPLGKKAYGIVVGLLALAGLLYQFRPDVSVEPYTTTDPKDPFQTLFKVTNDWTFKISNVNYVFMIDHMSSHFELQHVIATTFPLFKDINLAPKESTTTQIRFPGVPGVIQELAASVLVGYEPFPFWKRERRFCFDAKKDAEQNFRWLYASCDLKVFSYRPPDFSK